MSLLASGVLANQTTPYFASGGGGGGGGFPIQTNFVPSAPQAMLPTNETDKTFALGITTVAGGTYLVNVMIEFRSDTNVPNNTDVFQIILQNTSGTQLGGTVYCTYLGGWARIPVAVPQPVVQSIGGIMTNMLSEPLVVVVHACTDVVGAYIINTTGVVVQRIS